MTDWSALSHAYGEATDIPAILAALTPDPHSDAWGDLWSSVCHQGTVYSASYATLPHLFELAGKWAPQQRVAPVVLAGAIVVSTDVHGCERPALVGAYAELVRDLHRLALETLPLVDDATDFIHALQATLALQGDEFWGRCLDRLADGEFDGVCAHCDAALRLAIGTSGCFATDREWVNKPATKRTPIERSTSEQMPAVALWLLDQASKAGQDDVASWVRCLFGTTACPTCGRTISVSDAIHTSID